MMISFEASNNNSGVMDRFLSGLVLTEICTDYTVV